MGNKGRGGKGNYKSKAKRAEESGEEGGVVTPGGPGGPKNTSQTLTITLNKLDIVVLLQAADAKGEMVDIRWGNSEYDVYWKGMRLGSVPSNFNNQLMYPDSHRGRIKAITQNPRLVTISVTIIR